MNAYVLKKGKKYLCRNWYFSTDLKEANFYSYKEALQVTDNYCKKGILKIEAVVMTVVR